MASKAGDGFDTRGDELRKLLSPITPEEFLDRYFGRRPLYVSGHSKKFETLFSRKRFLAAVSRIPHHLQQTGTLNGSAGRGKPFPISAEQVEPMIASGGTICVSRINSYDPRLAFVANAVKSQLNYVGPVGFNCYLSGEGGGFGAHFDARVATTLQIAGRKRWRFSRSPAIPHPRQNAIVADGEVRHRDRPAAELGEWERIEAPDQSDFEEVVLQPGDLLCLPAGCWHEATAVGGDCLALNLFFGGSEILTWLVPYLEDRLSGSEAWRAGVRPSLASGDDFSPPEATLEELRDRIADVAGALSALAEDRGALRHVWNLLVARNAGPPPAPRATADPGELHERDMLKVVDSWPLRFATRTDERQREVLSVYAGPHSVDLPSASPALLQRMQRESFFRAGDAVQWTDGDSGPEWQELRRSLLALVQAGILEKQSVAELFGLAQ